ncbi:hypothetical protein [Sphingomonas profundi]|uniref:hypothetical protein n=1 Tax=Alterirhizorhabdus profundi TaxID=2681549 RepID=UPI0012E75304|nr:hypothetical protein [Sphingomonas profundi]
MSKMMQVPPALWLDKPDSFFEVGRNLRQAFRPALASSPDHEAEALLKLLMETSSHDMAAC